MEELKTLKLEDGIEYLVIDEIKNDNVTYLYLSNIQDEEDFCIRKKIDEDTLIGLKDDKEFDFALMLYMKRNSEI